MARGLAATREIGGRRQGLRECFSGVGDGVASFLLPKVTVGFPGNYRVPFKFSLLKQGVPIPDF